MTMLSSSLVVAGDAADEGPAAEGQPPPLTTANQQGHPGAVDDAARGCRGRESSVPRRFSVDPSSSQAGGLSCSYRATAMGSWGRQVGGEDPAQDEGRDDEKPGHGVSCCAQQLRELVEHRVAVFGCFGVISLPI